MRGVSPNRATPSRGSSHIRPRRSKRNDKSATSWAEYSEANQASTSNIPQESTLEMIPKHWTTKSGKFDPKQSEYGFDARSNTALQANSRNARRRLEKSNESSNDEFSSGDSEESQELTSNTSEVEQKKKKTKDKKAPIEGEIEDPIERRQFYKKLKKAGIQKTFQFDDNWETSSTNSEISEMSLGNASYILDLAQQKESRKSDRQEEALEEALELYGTWLTEGKTDDQNVFLMILQEVKKEQKAKYKEADNRHAALLDAALDEELKRREQVKKEEEAMLLEEDARQWGKAQEILEEETETIEVMSPGGRLKKKKSDTFSNHATGGMSLSNHSRSNHSTSSRRKSYYRKEKDSKITDIITKQKSFDSGDGDSNDSNVSFAERLRNSEDVDDITHPQKPLSRISRNSTHTRRRLFRMGSISDMAKSSRDDSQKSSGPPKEERKGLFGRLRRTLSQRQAEQRKMQETSWRDYSTNMATEEKWWNKINETKKDTVLFGHAKEVLDMTMNTAPVERPNSTAMLDFTTRTLPVSPIEENEDNSIDSTTNDKLNLSPSKKKKSAPEKKKKKKSERRSSVSDDMPSKHERKLALKFDVQDAKDEPVKVKGKKKKKKSKSLDVSKSKNITAEVQESLEGFMMLNDVSPKKKKKERLDTNSADSDDQSLGARSSKSSKSSKSTRSTRSNKSKSGKKKKSKRKNRHSRSGASSEEDVDWTDRYIVPTHSQDSAGLTAVTIES